MRSPHRHAAAAASLLLLAACSHGGSGGSSGPVKLGNDDEKTYYAVGALLGKNAAPFHMTPAQVELAKAGFADSATGAPLQVDLQVYAGKAQQLLASRGAEEAKKRAEADGPFRAAAAKEEGAKTTASGLIIRTLTPGTGKTPSATDTVKVHYTGRLSDGTVFDSSVQRGQPATFPLNGVVHCWTEGVALMKVGEKARLTCPSDIAYGDHGRPPQIPGGATLQFDIELLDILPATAGGPPSLGLPPGVHGAPPAPPARK